jgi:glycosyltransferase involved in cell wall biosynthesis
MKIVIVSTAYPLRGGIAHFVGLLYTELIKIHDVKILTFKRQYPKIFFPGKSQIEDQETTEKIPTEVIVDSINPFNWIKIGKRIFEEAPDLIIFKYWMPFFAPCFGTIIRKSKKKSKTKVLVICDNIIPHEGKPFDKSLTKYFFNKVDYFVVLSESVGKDLLKLYPEVKYKLLPHPIYSNFGNPINKLEARSYLKLKDEKYILFFGFVRDYKGLDILIQALSLINENIKVKLIVAGEFYEDEKKYLSLIDKLNLKNEVILFKDFIPTKEVKYYFCASDAVILPYKSATQSGIVQIAVNFQKPVIATNVGGLGEVIIDGETGYIVEKENPNMLAEAILKFYTENKENEFAKNISKIAEQYSWKSFSDGIFDLIKS